MLWKDRLKIERTLHPDDIYRRALVLSKQEATRRSRAKYDRNVGVVYPYRTKAIKQLVSEGLLHTKPL